MQKMVNSINIPCLSSFLIDLFVWVFNILFLLFEVSNCIKINNFNKPAMVAEWLKSIFLEPTSDLGVYPSFLVNYMGTLLSRTYWTKGPTLMLQIEGLKSKIFKFRTQNPNQSSLHNIILNSFCLVFILWNML